jgi:hypothetical protein
VKGSNGQNFFAAAGRISIQPGIRQGVNFTSREKKGDFSLLFTCDQANFENPEFLC